jgi:hypothetical protein
MKKWEADLEERKDFPKIFSVILIIIDAFLLLFIAFLTDVLIGIGDPPIPIDKTIFPSIEFLFGSFLFVPLAFVALIIWFKRQTWTRIGLLLFSCTILIWVLYFQIRYWFLGGLILSYAMFLFLWIEVAIIFGLYRGRKALKLVLPVLIMIGLDIWFFFACPSWIDDLTRIK